jgi:hypothetical protein
MFLPLQLNSLEISKVQVYMQLDIHNIYLYSYGTKVFRKSRRENNTLSSNNGNKEKRFRENVPVVRDKKVLR